MSRPVDEQRLALGDAAVLSIERASQLLGGRKARAWLRANVGVCHGPAGECVVWGDVLEALRRTNTTMQATQEPVQRDRRFVLLPADLEPADL